MPHLIYLHGFLSAPQSSKAQQTQAWLSAYRPEWQFHCPALSSKPRVAIAQIEAQLAKLVLDPVALIGSSLGGFWATGFAERHNLPAVLINPAVNPHLRFNDFLGKPLKNYYTEETYRLDDEDLVQLKTFANAKPLSEKLWVMVQSGDETLDYRLAIENYAGCKMTIEDGGSHSFDGYEQWLPKIVDFLSQQLNQTASGQN